MRGRDVLLDHRRDIRRRERVQIELRLDGKLEGIVGHGVRRMAGCSATTVVVMPPRAVKAPVTVIRRGLARGDEVVEDLVRGRFVEDAVVAIAEQVVLERLQLDARAVGDVADEDLAEVGHARSSGRPT